MYRSRRNLERGVRDRRREGVELGAWNNDIELTKGIRWGSISAIKLISTKLGETNCAGAVSPDSKLLP